MLGDCFFAVGQTIGMRTTVDYDAVIWWHDHFRAKFLAAMRRQGNRWLQDRENVTGVGWMLAERAVRHADGRSSIDVEAARRAAADVERYCEIRSKRAQAGDRDAEVNSRIAGYWCITLPAKGGFTCARREFIALSACCARVNARWGSPLPADGSLFFDRLYDEGATSVDFEDLATMIVATAALGNAASAIVQALKWGWLRMAGFGRISQHAGRSNDGCRRIRSWDEYR